MHFNQHTLMLPDVSNHLKLKKYPLKKNTYLKNGTIYTIIINQLFNANGQCKLISVWYEITQTNKNDTDVLKWDN